MKDYDFEWGAFLLQLHNVTFCFMNENVRRILGSKAGYVKEVESHKNRASWNRWLRARVRVHVSTPLKNGFWLTAPNGSRILVAFKFEKLPDYCYICGCLDHNENDCNKELELKYSSEEVQCLYGDWLRAKTYTPAKGMTSFSSSRRKGSSSSASQSNDECQ